MALKNPASIPLNASGSWGATALGGESSAAGAGNWR
jgi:hypothetical protein